MTFYFLLNKSPLKSKRKINPNYKHPTRTEMNKGDMYGKWMILKEATPRILPSGRKLRFAVCKCTECNKTIKELRYDSLRLGRGTQSCCLGAEICRKVNTIHGFRKHPIRGVHRNMIDRCYNTKNEYYHYYGGRGIQICKDWRHDLGAFGKWALSNGYEKGLQIDRIDNDGNYEPSNCRFVTGKVNKNNCRRNLFITHKGIRYSFIQFWEKFSKNKVKYSTARYRYQCQGLSAIDSVTLPV